jgi:polyhydroxyalkanoate synthesis regulator phasin
MLYDFLADPELLNMMTMDDEGLDQFLDQAVEEGMLDPEESEAMLEEMMKEMRKSIEESGLDEKTSQEMLKTMEQEARKELHKLLKTGEKDPDGKPAGK